MHSSLISSPYVFHFDSLEAVTTLLLCRLAILYLFSSSSYAFHDDSLEAFTTLLLCRLAILCLFSSSLYAFHDDCLEAFTTLFYVVLQFCICSVPHRTPSMMILWKHSLLSSMSSCNSVSVQFLTVRLP